MSARRVAAVTGAGSGIGREIALACARKGMAVAIADVEARALSQTQHVLAQLGAPCLSRVCDVAKASEVEAFAASCGDTWGGADWLFNNAGVALLGPAWQATEADWQWLWGVNVLGVAHGVRSFVPRMLARGTPAHVVNTASAAGLATLAGSAVYCASKHAVVAYSECLAFDLAQARASIGVSVLCPALVETGIARSQRNRPSELGETVPPAAAYEERVRLGMAASAITAADVAAVTLQAVEAGRFYVMPHEQTGASVQRRMHSILDDFLAEHPGAGAAPSSLR